MVLSSSVSTRTDLSDLEDEVEYEEGEEEAGNVAEGQEDNHSYSGPDPLAFRIRSPRLGRIGIVYRDEPNEPHNLVLYLVGRTKIVVSVLTLRSGRVCIVHCAKSYEPANLVLYLVRRTKINVSVLTLCLTLR